MKIKKAKLTKAEKHFGGRARWFLLNHFFAKSDKREIKELKDFTLLRHFDTEKKQWRVDIFRDNEGFCEK